MTEDEYPDNTEEAKGKAEESGFDIVVADDTMLTLDLDSIPDTEMWDRSKTRLADFGVYVS